jgi:hypothetical protein
MLQFTRRQNNLSIPASSIPEINERIKKFQEEVDIDFKNPSHLFMGLLGYFEKSISEKSNKEPEIQDTQEAPLTLLYADNSEQFDYFNSLMFEAEKDTPGKTPAEIVIQKLMKPEITDDFVPKSEVLLSTNDKGIAQVFEQRFIQYEEKFELVGKPKAESVSLALAAMLHQGKTNDQSVVAIQYSNDEELAEYVKSLETYKEEVLENKEASDASALLHAIENASIDVSELMNAAPQESTASNLEVPEGAILLKFKDEARRSAKGKVQLLELIARNRQVKKKLSAPETLPELIENILFTPAVILDYHGDFYTGLKSKNLKK